MKLSVVILNYQAPGFLEICVDSVARAVQEIPAEILVVDNNSPNQDFGFLKKYPKSRLIRNPENTGFASGNNMGVKQAKGEYICILNPDTIVGEQVFKSCMKIFDHPPAKPIGFIGTRLIDGGAAFLPESKRCIPTPAVAIRKIMGDDRSYYAHHVQEDENASVDILVGAFMFCQREVYWECGGFDERYFMYGEDIDLCYTALQKGYTNYYLGKETVIHFKGESTRKDKTYRKHFYNAMNLFYDKYFPSNFLLKSLVQLASKALVMFSGRRETSNPKPTVRQYILATNAPDLPRLKVSVSEQVDLNELDQFRFRESCLPQAQRQGDILFDCATLDYADVIGFMKETTEHDYRYRFLSPDRSFILGSDSSSTRGFIESC